MEWVAFTFGASREWPAAARRLQDNLLETGLFTQVWGFTPQNLPDYISERLREHEPFIESHERGYGYWIWKPIILSAIRSQFPNVGIAYFDAGVEIQTGFLSRLRLRRYLQISEKRDFMVFGMKHPENFWTKIDVLNQILPHQRQFPTGQVSASVLFSSGRGIAEHIEKEWLEYCTAENYRFVDDSKSREKESHFFVEHRHDQSILSLLVKRHGARILRDETHDPKHLPRFLVPIWAIRNGTGDSIIKAYIVEARKSRRFVGFTKSICDLMNHRSNS